jgi:hypothetical protein
MTAGDTSIRQPTTFLNIADRRRAIPDRLAA